MSCTLLTRQTFNKTGSTALKLKTRLFSSMSTYLNNLIPLNPTESRCFLFERDLAESEILTLNINIVTLNTLFTQSRYIQLAIFQNCYKKHESCHFELTGQGNCAVCLRLIGRKLFVTSYNTMAKHCNYQQVLAEVRAQSPKLMRKKAHNG